MTNAIGGGSPAWQQLSPSGTPPIGRDQTPGAYDQAHNELLVFAGEGFDAAGDAITFNDSWILAGANGVTSAQVAVSQLFPNHGGNAGSITVQVIGSGFQGGATVKLTAFGSAIIATNVTVPNTSVLTATFSLSGVAPGPGNVVVTNPDGTAATMVGGFTVESGGASKISVSILGRNALRLAFPQTFYLVLNDSGNLDASSFAASVGILATVSGLVPVVDAVADTYQSATVGEVDSFVVPSLPADSTQVIPFALTAPLGTSSFEIRGQHQILSDPGSGAVNSPQSTSLAIENSIDSLLFGPPLFDGCSEPVYSCKACDLEWFASTRQLGLAQNAQAAYHDSAVAFNWEVAKVAADITEGASAAILIGAAAANLAETGVAEGFLTNTQAATLNLTESTLVALSAIYDIAPEIVRKDDLFRKATAGVLDPMTKGEVELIVG